MKSMLVSLLIFLFAFSVVSVNAYFVTNYLDSVCESLEALPEASPDDDDLTDLSPHATGLAESWNDNFLFLSLSINMAELRDCAAALESLAAYTGTSEPADYNAALSAAKVRIKVLRARESFSFANIV